MNWPSASLGEVCAIISGATPRTEDARFWGGSIFWATPKDLSDIEAAFIDRTPRTITADGLKSCAASLLPPNSVLLSSRAPIGHVAINTVPMATNQGFKSLIPDPRILDSKFLYYWLKANTLFLQNLGNGATFKEISKAVVERVEIPLPPLDEQRRIAVILDMADALCRKRKRALDLLDSLTQSIFMEIFGDPIESPRYSTQSLGELIDKRGISYGIVQRGEDQTQGVDVLRISDIIDGQITGLGLKKTTKEIASKFKRTELVGNEIVISIRGTVGRCAIVPKMLAGSNVSREIAVIPTIEKKLNPFYLTLMRTDAAQRRLARDIKGVAQSGINLEDLRELPIIQPDNAVVDKFLTAQERFSRLEAAARISFNSMNFAFSSLQHRAFSGQL